MPRKSNRRELIIEVATTRFLVNGYDVVTVDELCDLSSSTKGSFYHFFENKEALAVDVVNHIWHRTQEELVAGFVTDISFSQKLSQEVDRVAGGYIRMDGKRHYVGCAVGTLAVGLRGKSQKLTRRLNFALNHMRQFYTDAYQEGRDQGKLKTRDSAAELADRFQLGLQGLSTMGKALQNGSRIRELSLELKKSIPGA